MRRHDHAAAPGIDGEVQLVRSVAAAGFAAVVVELLADHAALELAEGVASRESLSKSTISGAVV